MTYALAWPLQEGIYQVLSNDAAVAAFAGTRIYDAPLSREAEAQPDGIYVTLGDETVRDGSTKSDNGAVHLVSIGVHAPRRGFAEAKQTAGAISDALILSTIPMTRGRAVNVRFVEARTRRAEGDALRRIDLRFRITVEDTV